MRQLTAHARVAAQSTFIRRLWVPNKLPDNEIEGVFLLDLIVNDQLARRSYWKVMCAATAVAQQMSIVIAVASTALHLHRNSISPFALLIAEIVGAALGVLLFYHLAYSSKAASQWCQGFVIRLPLRLFLLISAAYFLCTCYASLTASISTDTIVFATAALLALHLYMHDYNHSGRTRTSYRRSLSLAAAMCASMLLSSRIYSTQGVFALVIYA
jgi:phosphatidylinositol N-acetylglucosaminyltransferase subunit C